MEEQIKQLIPGFIVTAAITIYAANYKTMSIDEASAKAKELINGLDLNKLFKDAGISD